MSTYRRGIFLINRSFQIRFSIYICLGLLALSFVYPLIIYNLFEYFFANFKADPASQMMLKIQETKRQVLWFLVAFQGTFLALCFLIGLFISHRIAGPLYKMQQYFDKAKIGDLTQELKFRKKDYFQELAEEYNSMISAIRQRNEKQTDAISAAMAHLDQVMASGKISSSEAKKELASAVSALKATSN